MPKSRWLRLVSNKSSGGRIEGRAKAASADLFIFGQIGSDWFDEGITDTMVAEALGELDGDVAELNVHLDSPGGDAFQGIAIYNLLADLSNEIRVNTIVQGWAASAASIIMQAGDVRRMAENSMTMIHNAYTITMGNKTELRKTADMMEKLDGNIAQTYASRSGYKVERFAELMNAETWFTPKEAMAAGLADEVIAAKAPADAAVASMQEKAEMIRMKFAAHYRNAPNRNGDAAFVPTERELEHYLRNIGCSKAVAKVLVSKVFDDDPTGGTLAGRRDAGDSEAADILNTVASISRSMASDDHVDGDLLQSLDALIGKIR